MLTRVSLPLQQPTFEASVIVCTRDRAQQLHAFLESVDVEQMREQGCELVLVDNGSVDDTPAVLGSFVEAVGSGGIQWLTELRTGKSFALNAGLSAARGRILAFTDDDCYLGENYFRSLRQAFRTGDFAYCGGQIRLYDPQDAFYVCNHNTEPSMIRPYVFLPAGRIQGANMAFRREVVERIGGFDTMFGAGLRFRCADIDFAGRAAQAGFKGAHVPELIVFHHHGRRHGDDLERLKRQNDYARGAYYAKFILAGHWRYLTRWFKLSLRRGKQSRFTEVRGAWAYVWARAWRAPKALKESGRVNS